LRAEPRFGAWSLVFHRLHNSITPPIRFMPMIDKSKIIETVQERLRNLPTGHYLDLRTYKRNRSVIIAKMAEDDLLIIENGYFREKFRLKPEKLKKALKIILRKEFPRSRKIRLYVMGRFSEEEASRTRRKVL
ncbi:MAG: hypothetical protein PVH75_11870, partial [Syntrophobacterales bacterium]